MTEQEDPAAAHDGHRQSQPRGLDLVSPGLGDLAYEGCERMLTGRKHPAAGQDAMPWTEADEFLRNLIAHYRSRVKSVIHRIKAHAWCEQVFRGAYEVCAALYHITVLTTALEIKNEFELDDKVMFEVVGPWPHDFSRH